MKAKELSAALAAPTTTADIRELHSIANELKRYKYLLSSVASRKCDRDSETDSEIYSAVSIANYALSKVRIGGIVKRWVMLQRTREYNKKSGYDRNIESWVSNIVSSADRMLTACAKTLDYLSSSKISAEKKIESAENVKKLAFALVDIANGGIVNDKFSAANAKLKQIPIVVPETLTDAPESRESVETTNAQPETQNAVESKETASTETSSTGAGPMVYYVDPEYTDTNNTTDTSSSTGELKRAV